jgi:ppGpp synthetase/RelA/SpoT-type nucleotidyltranferase
MVDRRANPSYGYRAVHLIVKVDGALVEIQIRSSLQHLWAELSEKFSDVVDPSIKYGGGPPNIRDLLALASGMIAGTEEMDVRLADLETSLAEAKQMLVSFPKKQEVEEVEKQVRDLEQRCDTHRESQIADHRRIVDLLNRTNAGVPKLKGRKR